MLPGVIVVLLMRSRYDMDQAAGLPLLIIFFVLYMPSDAGIMSELSLKVRHLQFSATSNNTKDL